MGIFGPTIHEHTHRSETKVTVNHGNKNVHEYRAPTDDSIRLAKEYEEKIKKDILRTMIVDHNHLKGTFVIEKDCLENHLIIGYVFDLNGHIIKAGTRVDLFKLTDDINSIHKVADELRNSVIKEIANHFTNMEFLYTSGIEVLNTMRGYKNVKYK